MTTTSHSVISGVAYPVDSVAGRAPALLAQFVNETEFTVDMAGERYLVRGCGSGLRGRVRFYEKDGSLGRDVRVWHVTATDEGFTAEHAAAF